MNKMLLELESRLSFDFFWLETNNVIGSPGYGLTRDRAPGHKDISSIASVGFGLSALVIGAERGYVPYDKAFERALATLNTLLYNTEHINGFFYHFLNINNGKRALNSEISVIDTAIAVNGAFVAGEYFGGKIREKAYRLYKRINWQWYTDPLRDQFYMGYTPEHGFSGWWDFYAEQIMLYVLGAGSPTYKVSGDMFYKFIRHTTRYKDGEPFINSWHGSIFTYQFSHAWIDLRDKRDKWGIDWWANSVNAVKANKKYCIDMGKYFKTLHSNSWGLTPCDGPSGYKGRYGAAPCDTANKENYVDGTVPPAGILGSIVFSPQDALEAMEYLYENHPELWSVYGFKDAYNLDVSPAWYADDVIGIDKGISLLMIENYRTGLIWEYFMRNPFVQNGMKEIGLREEKSARGYYSSENQSMKIANNI